MSTHPSPTAVKDGSAFWGEYPASQHDSDIMVGLLGGTKPPKRVPITDYSDHRAGLLGGVIFAMVVIALVTIGRLLTRAFRKGQKFGADDWVIIPAMVSHTTCCIYDGELALTELDVVDYAWLLW